MGGRVGENPAALRAAVFFRYPRKTRGGGVQTPPPSRARVMVVHCVIKNKHLSSVFRFMFCLIITFIEAISVHNVYRMYEFISQSRFIIVNIGQSLIDRRIVLPLCRPEMHSFEGTRLAREKVQFLRLGKAFRRTLHRKGIFDTGY